MVTPYEKHAWFNLAVLLGTAALFGLLIPFLGLAYASAALGLLGLWALGPMFYERPNQLDERVVTIQHRASRAALMLYWIALIAIGLVAWLLARYAHAALPQWIPHVMLGGLILYVLVHAVTTLAAHNLENSYAGG